MSMCFFFSRINTNFQHLFQSYCIVILTKGALSRNVFNSKDFLDTTKHRRK